ncbi:Zip-domain-containing protein [Hypoxylon sp. FL0543]|nr:Zip-domain-containing protein [Hypoxylon sp. FL0543]
MDGIQGRLTWMLFCIFLMISGLQSSITTAGLAIPLHKENLGVPLVGCRMYGDEVFCIKPDGSEVHFPALCGGESSGEGNSVEGRHSQNDNGGEKVHVHDGVFLHRDEDDKGKKNSALREQEYNVFKKKFKVHFIALKQLGTGAIIATVFVHLLPDTQSAFADERVGKLAYKPTPAALVMGGVLLAFVMHYVSHRVARKNKLLGVKVLEGCMIFHSLLVGVTLGLTDEKFFPTFFVIILFHQMLEGLALGTLIATADSDTTSSPAEDQLPAAQRPGTTENLPLSLVRKTLMALAFAVATPVGIGIGISAIKGPNTNDPRVLFAFGALNSVSAGVFLWVGVVEMLAKDWMFGGEMADAELLVTLIAGVCLMTGVAIMAELGGRV